jgi:hypothetical protein
MDKKLVNMKIGIMLLQVVNQLHFQKNQKRENNINNNKKTKNPKLIKSSRYIIHPPTKQE